MWRWRESFSPEECLKASMETEYACGVFESGVPQMRGIVGAVRTRVTGLGQEQDQAQDTVAEELRYDSQLRTESVGWHGPVVI